MVIHFWGLARLWRNPDDPATLKLAFITHSISLFYSIKSPLLTGLRFAFLEPGTTEATAGILVADIVASLIMAATTSAYLLRHCWRTLGSGRATP